MPSAPINNTVAVCQNNVARLLPFVTAPQNGISTAGTGQLMSSFSNPNQTDVFGTQVAINDNCSLAFINACNYGISTSYLYIVDILSEPTLLNTISVSYSNIKAGAINDLAKSQYKESGSQHKGAEPFKKALPEHNEPIITKSSNNQTGLINSLNALYNFVINSDGSVVCTASYTQLNIYGRSGNEWI